MEKGDCFYKRFSLTELPLSQNICTLQHFQGLHDHVFELSYKTGGIMNLGWEEVFIKFIFIHFFHVATKFVLHECFII